MFFYAGRTFRASIAGSIIKEVVCEKCQSAYQYQMVRRGEGASSAPYYLGQEGAKRRAEERARTSLQKRLKKGIDPVPCADCGWIQANMVNEMRRRSLRWLMWVGIVILILGVLICGIWTITATQGFSNRLSADDQKFLIGASLTTAIAAAAIFGIRWLVQRSINPNSGYPQRPSPIPGMPRAFKPGMMDVVFENSYAPAPDDSGTLQYERRPPLVTGGGWVTVQLLKIRFPRTCCSCLGPTDSVYLYPLSSRTDKVPVRICPTCRKSSSTRVWVITSAFTVIGASLMGLWMYTSSSEQDRVAGLIGGVAIGSIFCGLFGYFAVARRFRPVRFSRFFKTYYTLRLRFRNRQYTTPFADENQMA